MSGGFTISPGETTQLEGPFDLKGALHQALDNLIAEFATKNGSFGGAVFLNGTTLGGDEMRFKITLAYLTDQKDCVSCGGSGLDGG